MEPNNSANVCTRILEETNIKMVNVYFPVIVYLGIAMILGSIGNCFVSYIYYYKFDETATHIFTAALSICDFLTCVICIPMDIIVLYFPYTFHSDTACRVIRYAVAIAIINSALIVFIIAVDRYILICRPLKQNISVKNSKKILVFLTICALVLCMPAFFVHSKQNKMLEQCGNIGEMCSLSPYINGTMYPLVYYTFGLTASSGVFITFVVIYLLIGMRIWKIYKAKKKRANHEVYTTCTISKSEILFTDTSSSEKRSTSFARLKKRSMPPARSSLIFFIITLVWIIAYIPHFGGVFWSLFVKDFDDVSSDKDLVINKFLSYSFYLSPALHPYIYGLFSRQFRNELLVSFRKISQTCKEKNIETR